MIDRVGNGPGYEYTRVNDRKINNNAAGTGEKFQLDYGKEGAIYEPSSAALKEQQAEKKVATQTAKNQQAEAAGVKLTLSSTGIEKAEESKKESASFIDAMTEWLNKTIESIKAFVKGIWNDTPVETTSSNETISLDEEISASQEADMADDAKEVIATTKPKTQFEKAKAEAEAFLASTEGKKVARNSDLLTYYDRHGLVVSLSASDKQRILYGDKNHIDI